METRSRVALVTGASRGIGKGIVLELAAQGYEFWKYPMERWDMVFRPGPAPWPTN